MSGKSTTLSRKQGIMQSDGKLSQLNDPVESHVSRYHDALNPSPQSHRVVDQYTGPCRDISNEDMLLHLDSKLKSFSLSEEKLKRTGIGLQPKSSQNKPANLVPINWLPQEILAYIIEIGWEQEEEEKKKWMARAEVEGCAARVRDFGPDGLIPNHDSDALIDYLYQAKREVGFGILCSWVCKKWRRVALAMPTLWSKINIRDHPPYERALEYAKRTKTTPLSVHINLLKHFSDPSNLDYALDRTLEIISPEVHRVTSLVVEVPFQAGLLRILHAFFRFRRPPPLERFQVMSYEYFNIGIDSETPTDRIFPQGQLLGNIRHLDLDNVDISWNRVRFRNLDSLRVANLGGPTLLAMHHVCAIIGACPRLESLILENLSPSDEIDVLEQINPVPIALPYLRTLQFKQVHVDGFMFRILNARNLVHLTLHELESDGHNEHLPRFIQGLQSARTIRSRVVVSETKLEYLQISKCRFNLDYVKQLIVSSPNLRELYIDSMDCVTDALFSLFVSKPVEKGACKKLEILRIVDCQNLTSAEVLKRVVSSRRGKKRDSGVKELERLDVKSCPVSNESKTKKWFERNVVDLCWVT